MRLLIASLLLLYLVEITHTNVMSYRVAQAQAERDGVREDVRELRVVAAQADSMDVVADFARSRRMVTIAHVDYAQISAASPGVNP